eukprot:214269_1
MISYYHPGKLKRYHRSKTSSMHRYEPKEKWYHPGSVTGFNDNDPYNMVSYGTYTCCNRSAYHSSGCKSKNVYNCCNSSSNDKDSHCVTYYLCCGRNIDKNDNTQHEHGCKERFSCCDELYSEGCSIKLCGDKKNEKK